MDQLQLAMIVMATTESPWAPRDTGGRRRELTAEELDALVEFGWLMPDLKGVLTACAQAVRPLWWRRARNSVASPRLPASSSSSMSARPSVAAN